MSLNKPHPMYTYAVTSYQVNKIVTVSRLLSGRFRSGSLVRHFYPDKVSGICELCHQELEDIPHIILPRCAELKPKAQQLLNFAQDSLTICATAAELFDNIFMQCEDDTLKVQFMLDPSVIPEVITAAQQDRNILAVLYRITTTWCHSLVRTRSKLLH